MNPLPFQFPILAFGPNAAPRAPGEEFLDYFIGPEDFSTCVSWKLKYRDGMILADSNSRCWTIIDVQNLGVTGPFWNRILRFLARQSMHRISCELSEAASLPLDRLKARVCSAINADPSSWEEEHVPEEGWDDPWQWQRQQLEDFKERVTASRSVSEIINVLFGEHFGTGSGA
jgi:hypothetical protein